MLLVLLYYYYNFYYLISTMVVLSASICTRGGKALYLDNLEIFQETELLRCWPISQV